MRISLDVTGEDVAARHLEGLAQRAEDARPFFERVSNILLSEERALWRTQPGWVPLDPDTVRRKAREGVSPRILRATGALERALTVWGAEGQRLEIQGDRLVFGIDPDGPVSYGMYHQYGQGVPRRPIMQTTRSTRTRVRDAMYDHLFGR